jgi:hypothetical protein
VWNPNLPVGETPLRCNSATLAQNFAGSGISVDISMKSQRKKYVSGEANLSFPQPSGFGTKEGIKLYIVLIELNSPSIMTAPPSVAHCIFCQFGVLIWSPKSNLEEVVHLLAIRKNRCYTSCASPEGGPVAACANNFGAFRKFFIMSEQRGVMKKLSYSQ